MLLVVGGLLMIAGAGCFALMWRQNVACWVYLLGACLFGGMQLIYNKWVLLLLVAAMLELYTMLRISSELNGK